MSFDFVPSLVLARVVLNVTRSGGQGLWPISACLSPREVAAEVGLRVCRVLATVSFAAAASGAGELVLGDGRSLVDPFAGAVTEAIVRSGREESFLSLLHDELSAYARSGEREAAWGKLVADPLRAALMPLRVHPPDGPRARVVDFGDPGVSA